MRDDVVVRWCMYVCVDAPPFPSLHDPFPPTHIYTHIGVFDGRIKPKAKALASLLDALSPLLPYLPARMSPVHVIGWVVGSRLFLGGGKYMRISPYTLSNPPPLPPQTNQQPQQSAPPPPSRSWRGSCRAGRGRARRAPPWSSFCGGPRSCTTVRSICVLCVCVLYCVGATRVYPPLFFFVPASPLPSPDESTAPTPPDPFHSRLTQTHTHPSIYVMCHV